MIQNKQITFGDLGVSNDLFEVLEGQKLTNPTPIQEKCISIGLKGKDILGIAQTGTGKTLAFGLPALEKIKKENGKCLIILPTRELAIQVHEVLSKLGRPFGIKNALLIGGMPSRRQRFDLLKNPKLIIATPGRLIDHIKQNNCNLKNIKLAVLDEADRMFDIGFMPQIKEILKTIPADRQTMLFSATMPYAVSELSAKYMTNPVRIEVSPSGTSAANISQEAHIVTAKNKQNLLKKVIAENSGSILIFTRTKFRAKKIALILRQKNLTAAEMHSNRTFGQRKNALNGFKSGRFQILVATDVAARGLDVDDISLVLNLDLPDSLEDYVHRIGRTGRAGKKGKAISFIEPEQEHKLKKIERIIKKEITIIEGSEKFKETTEYNNKRSGSDRKRANRLNRKKKNWSSNDKLQNNFTLSNKHNRKNKRKQTCQF